MSWEAAALKISNECGIRKQQFRKNENLDRQLRSPYKLNLSL